MIFMEYLHNQKTIMVFKQPLSNFFVGHLACQIP